MKRACVGVFSIIDTFLYFKIVFFFQEMVWGSMDWTELAQDRDRWCVLVNAVMNLRTPYSGENFLTG